MTGIKSSLQLIFVLLTIQIVTIIPERYIMSSKLFFEKNIFLFLVSYTIVSYLFSDSQDRFEGGTGAQGLALQLSLLTAYLCGSLLFKRALQFFIVFILFLTGSRTYLILAALVLAYDYLKKSSLRLKVIVLSNIVAICILLIALLPYTDSRFNYTSDQFLGSFWGRFHNYREGIKLIEQQPITGNGMGSMLKVLETWVNQEGRAYYQKNGDTTIMHNEYMRIMVEIGILGILITLYGVIKVWKKYKTNQVRYMMFIFLIASLLENTLTMYTTGTLFFILLISFAAHSHGWNDGRFKLTKQ
jgi:O-antigen ligase